MDEYPTIPGHLKRALEFTPVDDSDLTEIWQVLCDNYGRSWAGNYEITIHCADDRPEED